MIEPTPGRVVWYRPNNEYDAKVLYAEANDALAAIVAYVHTPRCVNLMVIDAHGGTHPRTSVMLLQDDDPVRIGETYCEWMPYQKGQAAKQQA